MIGLGLVLCDTSQKLANEVSRCLWRGGRAAGLLQLPRAKSALQARSL